MAVTYYDSRFLDALFVCNHPKAAEIATGIFNNAYNDLLFYAKEPMPFYASTENKRQMCMVNAQWVTEVLRDNRQTELSKEFEPVFNEMYGIYSGNVDASAIEAMPRR